MQTNNKMSVVKKKKMISTIRGPIKEYMAYNILLLMESILFFRDLLLLNQAFPPGHTASCTLIAARAVAHCGFELLVVPVHLGYLMLVSLSGLHQLSQQVVIGLHKRPADIKKVARKTSKNHLPSPFQFFLFKKKLAFFPLHAQLQQKLKGFAKID